MQQQQQQRRGVQYCPHGSGVYNLGLEMGQHIDIIAIIGDTDIIARFRVRQLRVAVFVCKTAIFVARRCQR